MSRLALHFLQAIRERLNGEDGLGYEIDVTNVYLQKSLESETSSYPFVIVNPVNEYPDPLTNCTDGGPFSSEVQFTVFSTDDEEAMRIRDAAYRVLAPGKPLLVFGDGVDRAHIPGLKWQFTQPGQKPGGKLIWAFGFQYRFLLERSY